VWHNTDFGKISEWTGDEQRAIVKQLVALVTPLLITTKPYAIHFTRAVCDFVTISHYQTHDNNTLEYLQDALQRIDALKEIFQLYRPRKDKKNDQSAKHFNLPKLHALTH
jgi:hypothetical protein